ncbi:MAG: transporter substrate-binding domain-containing protein [Pseudomonadota bacterium]
MKSVFFFFFFLLFTSICAVAAGTSLMISTNGEPPYGSPDFTGPDDLIVREAFQRIGINPSFSLLPSERALINLDSGIDDGNYPRIAGIDVMYPNLLQVPEKLRDSFFVAFAQKENIKLAGWHSLASYNVAFINGWKIFENNVGQVKSLTKVVDGRQLFTLLQNGRADIVLYEKAKGRVYIKENGLKNIYAIDPPLEKKAMYLYVHRRHEKLVPRLASAIKKMKKDGTYSSIFNQELSQFLISK